MPSGRVAETVGRSGLWRAQTPQGFRFTDILAAHEAAAAAGRSDLTDDAAVAEWAGLAVTLVDGSEANRKLTTAEDLAMVQNPDTGLADVRTGQGFDVHRFAAGDHVWLCGVKIAHTHGLEGHSDADVGLHALTDALLGAIGDGDIGEHFPNTDARWKGAASHVFLADALRRVQARGGAHHQRRCDTSLRGAQDCPASRRHAPAHRRGAGDRGKPRRGEGHDHGRPRLYRAPRGHCRPCHSHRDPAVTRRRHPPSANKDVLASRLHSGPRRVTQAPELRQAAWTAWAERDAP